MGGGVWEGDIPLPIGDVYPCEKFFLIDRSQSAYFGAFSDPSDEHIIDQKNFYVD